MDGDVNYHGYTNQGLLESLRSIDRVRFPKNFANLNVELDRRNMSGLPDSSLSPSVVREVIWPIGPAAGTADPTSLISLWKYVVLFASIFYVGAFFLGILVEYLELKSGSTLGKGLIFAAAMVVGHRFVRRHRRLFYAREAHRLMLYCLLSILPLEAIALLWNPEILDGLSAPVTLIALPVTVGVNVLFVWIAYRFFARRLMLRQLSKLEPSAA